MKLAAKLVKIMSIEDTVVNFVSIEYTIVEQLL